MDYETVKALLAKHYCVPDQFPYIKVAGDTDLSRSYYSIDLLDRIERLRSTLQNFGDAPTLTEKFDTKYNGFEYIPETVDLYMRGSNWFARFYKITGVNYVRDKEGTVTAYLFHSSYPDVSLSDKEPDFYGYWKKLKLNKNEPYKYNEGISYWVNKTLRQNAKFRAFSVDFLNTAADENKEYILKDIARAIENFGCFLPPIRYDELSDYRTPGALVKSFIEEDPALSVDFNKKDINLGYAMVKLAEDIDPRDKKIIKKLDDKTVSDTISLKMLYDGFSSKEFTRQYYRNKLSADEDDYELMILINDYVEMSAETSELLRLSFDRNGLEHAHNELAVRARDLIAKEELQSVLVQVPSVFDRLEKKIKSTGVDGFERIVTMARLHDEGNFQHNCVFSRRFLIKQDQVSVYHWDHEGESYTVQFYIDTEGKYHLEEVRARFNKAISEEHLQYLKDKLKDICIVDNVSRAFLPAIGVPAEHIGEFIDFHIDDEDLPF